MSIYERVNIKIIVFSSNEIVRTSVGWTDAEEQGDDYPWADKGVEGGIQ